MRWWCIHTSPSFHNVLVLGEKAVPLLRIFFLIQTFGSFVGHEMCGRNLTCVRESHLTKNSPFLVVFSWTLIFFKKFVKSQSFKNSKMLCFDENFWKNRFACISMNFEFRKKNSSKRNVSKISKNVGVWWEILKKSICLYVHEFWIS